MAAEDRQRRIAAAGVRRHRADQRHRHHVAEDLRKRDGDRYIVNGQKIWTSRAEHSDLMILLARTTPKEQVQEAHRGLSVFIVDMREAIGNGLTIRPIRTMMNHETEVFFDDMKVPAENLIGEEGKGFRYILSGMNAERILIAAECIGDAKWFIAKATAYAKERVVFGRPIGQNQGVQFPIAKAYASMRAAELMVKEARANTRPGSTAAPRPTWPRCWRPMPPGKRPMPACRPMAASASPKNTTSSASSARRGSIRWRRSRPI
jgi:alkylation response protein AidB-like acyl-CoA dehydrogenase